MLTESSTYSLKYLMTRNIFYKPGEGEGEVAQSCPTLCDPMDYNLPGFSVHGILQARILKWIAISFFRGSSRPRDRTRVSRIGGRSFNLWATREVTNQLLCIYALILWILFVNFYHIRLVLTVVRHIYTIIRLLALPTPAVGISPVGIWSISTIPGQPVI